MTKMYTNRPDLTKRLRLNAVKTLLFFLLLTLSNLGFAQNVNVSATMATTSGTYPTLKAAFDAINIGTHQGAITIEIVGNTTETASAVLKGSGVGASYTDITIRPSGGAARTISGTIATGPLIDLDGADNVTFNGLNLPGDSLIMVNTSNSSTNNISTIRLFNDAQKNTITHCTVNGASQTNSGTVSGNILISSNLAGGVGNDSNTISYCQIGPASASLYPSKGITVYNNSFPLEALSNNAIIIENNNIYDYFHPNGQASYGITLQAGATGVTVRNNRLYQTSTKTMLTGGNHAAIHLSNTGSLAGFIVENNTIGYSASDGTGTYTIVGASNSRFFGIFIQGTGTAVTAINPIKDNIITAINFSGPQTGSVGSGNSAFNGIFCQTGIIQVTGNMIGGTTSPSHIQYTTTGTPTAPIDVIGILVTQAPCTVVGNTVAGITANITTSSASSGFGLYGIRFNGTTLLTNTIQDNIIGYAAAPMTVNSANTVIQNVGIHTIAGMPLVSGNIIRYLRSNAPSNGAFQAASVLGIFTGVSTFQSGYSQIIRNNQIYALGNTNTTSAASITGIAFAGIPLGNSYSFIEKNLLYGFSLGNSLSSSSITGITTYLTPSTFVGAGVRIANNFISLGLDMDGNSTGTCPIIGISETANNIHNTTYHNSVHIGGTSSGTIGIGTYAFRSLTTARFGRSVRNNIFSNTRSNTGADPSKHYAIAIPDTGLSHAGLEANYNLLYAPGTGGHIGQSTGGTVSFATMADWQTGTGIDLNSQNGDPQFLNATAGTPDLHINTAVGSLAESAGILISEITDDYDGNIRSSLTPVDIGADAFNGIALTPSFSNVIVTPATPSCTAVPHTVSIDITVPSATIDSAILIPYFNGVTQASATMTSSGNTWTGTIVAAAPTNAVVTWSVVAYSGSISNIYTHTSSYRDDYLLSDSTVISASAVTICNGESSLLSVASKVSDSTIVQIGTFDGLISSGDGNPVRSTSIAIVKTQMLWRASELQAAGILPGKITSLTFYLAAPGGASALSISMLNTTATATNTVYFSGLTPVFSGTTQLVLGSNTIYLDSPFEWDGVSNVVLNICNSNTALSSSIYVTNTTYFSSSSTGNTGAPGCSLTTTGITNILMRRPVIGFGCQIGQILTNSLTWNWTPGNMPGISVSVSPTDTTLYTVTGTDANGCTVSVTDTVNVNALPDAPVTVDSSQCGAQIPTATVSSTLPTAKFKWYDAATGGNLKQFHVSATYQYPVTTTSTFYVSTVDSLTGCESLRSPVTITVSQPDSVAVSVSAGPYCSGSSITLTASQIGSTNSYTYAWTESTDGGLTSFSGASVTANPIGTGLRTYTVTATDGPCAYMNSISITMDLSPSLVSVTASPSTICAGDSTTLTALSNKIIQGTNSMDELVTTLSSFSTNPYRINGGTQGADAKMQVLLRKSELEARGFRAGNIYDIGFYVTTPAPIITPVNNFTIKVAHTNVTALNAIFETPAFTTVVSESSYLATSGLNTHTFSTPFNWDGTSNIVFEFCNTAVISPTTQFAVAVDTLPPPTTNAVSTGLNAVGACAIGSGGLNNQNLNLVAYPARPLVYLTGNLSVPVTNALTYSWTPGSTSANPYKVAPSVTTDYTVTGTETSGCSVEGVATVTVNPLYSAPIATNNTRCGYGLPNVSVSSTTGEATPVFAWFLTPTGGTAIQTSTSTTLTTYNVSATTTFYVGELNTTTLCVGERVAVIQTVSPSDSVALTASDLSLCPGESSLLTATQIGSTQNYTYAWTATPVAGSGIEQMSAASSLVFADFTSLPAGATLSGNASITPGYLQLTQSAINQAGAFELNGGSVPVDSLYVSFSMRASANNGEGISYSFADDGSLTSTTPGFENGTGSKLTISFDGRQTTVPNLAGIYLMYGPTTTPGTTDPNVLAYSSVITWKNIGLNFQPVEIFVDRYSRLTLKVNGVTIFNNVQLPSGYSNADKSTWKHYFKARTTNSGSEQAIDNLSIATASVSIPALTTSSITADPNVLGSFTYQVVATDTTLGCAYSNTVTIVKQPTPLPVKAGSDQSVCVGTNITVGASNSTLIPAIRFTELISTVGAGTNPPLSFPPFITSWIGSDLSKSLIEITNLSAAAANLSGITIELWGVNNPLAPASTITIPANAADIPPGGFMYISFHGATTNDVVNNFYTNGTNNQLGGSQNQGFVIRKGSVIIDAFAINNYTFSSYSGVTTSDWVSPSFPSFGNLSGAIMIQPDVNNGASWVGTSGTYRGNPGVLNSGLLTNLEPTGTGISWISDPAGFTASTPVATFGPILDTTQFIAIYDNGICSSYDTLIVTLSGNDTPDITAVEDTFCLSGTALLSITDFNASYTYQWISSASASGPWSVISGETSGTYSPALSATADSIAYFRVIGACSAFISGDTSAVLPIFISHPKLTSTSGASRCGYGSVSLTAASDPGQVVRWFDQPIGGTLLSTGTSFVTPSINSTTTYYAEAHSSYGTDVIYSGPVPTFNQEASGAGLVMNLDKDVTINSVDVFALGSGSVTVFLSDLNNTPIYVSGSIPIQGLGSGVPVTIPLGWYVPAGVNYRLRITSIGANLMYSGSPGYPQNLGGGIGTITNSITNSGQITNSSYLHLYNLNLSTGCFTARVPVTATINPSPAVILTANDTIICEGETVNLSASSSNDPDYTYVWSNGFTGSSQSVSPSITTTYNVVATDNTAGPNAGCSNLQTVTIKVNANPLTPTITKNPLVTCAGVPITLSAESSAPTTAIVGTATDTILFLGYTPYMSMFEGSKIQYLIPASELSSAGIIAGPLNGLAFNVVGSVGGLPQSGFELKMKQTANGFLSAFETGLSTVYTAVGGTTATAGWNNYDFTSPFIWDGTSNLIVEVCHNNDPTGSCSNCGTSGNPSVESTHLSYTSTIGQYSNNTAGTNPWDLCSQSTVGTSFSNNYRPVMRFNSGIDPIWTWSTGATSSSIIVTPSGNTTYTVTATNFNGCTSSNSILVEPSPLPQPLVTPGDTTICSGNVIMIAVRDTGFYSAGYPVGTIVDWVGIVNGQTPQDSISSDNGTSYQAVVTLPGGCSATSSVRTIITRSVSTSPVYYSPSCGLDNGKIVTSITAGTAPFRYIWKQDTTVIRDITTSNTVDSISDLAAGLYTLEVIDEYPNGCSSGVLNYALTSLDQLTAVINQTSPVNCNGENSATLLASYTGGSGTVSYLWNTGLTSNVLSSVGAGTYTVTVTDNTGCSDSETFTVTQPDVISAVFTPVTPTCVGGMNGSISAVISGGTTPYQVVDWYDPALNPIGTGNTLTGVPAGDYVLYIQDANSCEGILNVTLNDAAPLDVVSFTPPTGPVGTVVTINGTGLSSVTAVSFNGTPATVFSAISDSQISATVPSGATTGLITVTTTCGSDSSTTPFTVSAATASMNLTVLLEGYYAGSAMNSVMLNQGVSLDPNVCDSITVGLHDPLSPSTIVYSQKVQLNINGLAQMTWPSAVIGQSYYISVQHRSSVMTSSAMPVTFSSSTSYDFTGSAGAAFNSNQIQVAPGKFAIYSGDINQDGFLGVDDVTLVDNDNLAGVFGVYVATDVNGDGFLGVDDVTIVDNNNLGGIFSIMP